ncbi:proline-, glutamic acid- and leucine-rich protein 1-like [Apis laboriosa]|uniref:proline-, glutamic acid- and leucine-rich protein 1-like n=1 Tax=Apis laboriosa TaxID=183418 RepID=UPI001CC78865|nr:proline-, glutamic acid- and leucine-rich protein 1-like [Apis laboriosa]
MDLINFFDHNSKEYNEFLQYLINFSGDIPFNIEEIDKIQNIIISTINTYLNQSQSRYNGLLILDKILSQCSKDIFSKYCILWISKSMQVLESIHSTLQELSISCKVLGSLIIQSKNIPEIQKQVSTQIVKQFINTINNLNSEKKCGPIYYLIAVLLHQYPEVCERFQISIKKIILLQIDSSQKNLVNASARCYALLAKATERSFKSSVSKSNYTCWTYNQALICNSLHVIMDKLFSNLIELENVNISDKLDLPNISEENIIQFYFKQKQRFLNLCSYLSYMLCGLGTKNSVLPHEILKVLCRGLAIQPSNIKNQNSVKEQILYLILPELHIALFNVLDSLINGFKEQLIPFGLTILQLFLQTLQWTENVLVNQITISGNKPFRNVRISVYKCLNSWLMNTNSLSGIETIADEYLLSILKDIVPEKDRILLTIQKTQNLSKRALKRLRDSQYEKGIYLNNGIASDKEHYLHIDTCKIALDILQNIFFSSGTFLKQTFFKTVQSIVISLLYDCYLSNTEQKFYKEYPDCRLLLLRVLRASQMNPHSLMPLPTQYSLEIFEMALNDNNLYIIQEAKIALAELEKIIHPYAPPIQLTQVEIIQKEFVSDDQIVQEHNVIIEDGTSSNIETVLNKSIEPSSNKRLKITNSNKSETISNIQNKIDVVQTNQDPLEERDDTVEKQMTITIQNENIIENEQVVQICKKSANETSVSNVINIGTSDSISSLNIMKQTDNRNHESMDTTENINPSPENSTSEVNQINSELEKGEEEILQLFQDIPKN